MGDKKTMAKCPYCGSTSWVLGNHSDSVWSVGFYKCAACMTCAVFVSQGTANVFIVAGQGDPAPFPRQEYVDRAVRPAWAMEFERLEAARAELSKACREETNEALGLPADTKGPDIPERARVIWRLRLDELHASDAYRRPKGFERSPLPPQMPPGMRAFVRQPTGWEPINPEDTAKLPIPMHPQRARHDKEFADIFAAMKAALEVEFVPTELPSGYWGKLDDLNLAPWYSFFIGPVEFTVGPRKNVVAISAKSPLRMDLTEIKALSARDKPTYDDDGAGLEVSIHAWGSEKLLEYLIAIGRAARALGRPGRGPRSDMPFQVRGFVNWPTHLYDDGQGGMVVLAVVDGWIAPATPGKPWRHDCWSRAELIEPNHYGISPERMEPVLACVPLGSSDGCWWRGEPDPKKHRDEDPYCPWECTLKDLTDDGRDLVEKLQQLYGRPVRLVTHIDT